MQRLSRIVSSILSILSILFEFFFSNRIMNQIAPVKLARVIERHAELFHHAARSNIFRRGDGDDFIEPQRFKAVAEKRPRGFAYQAFAPESGRNRVADFRFARFLEPPQTAPADKLARAFFDDGAKAYPLGCPEARNQLQPVDAFLPVLRRADKTHHCRVAAQGENRVRIVFVEAAQDESFGFKHKNYSQYKRIFGARANFKK